MPSFLTPITAALTLAAAATVTGPALATPAIAAPADSASHSAVAGEQVQGVDGTRFVMRNTTSKSLMLYCAEGGDPTSSHEHYMGILHPNREMTFTGYNDTDGTADVYVRVYTRQKGTGEPVRATMVAAIAANNHYSGWPYLKVNVGLDPSGSAYTQTAYLTQHETHDSWTVTDANRFKAWIHRDGDHGDGYKTLKLTVKDIDTTPTRDLSYG